MYNDSDYRYVDFSGLGFPKSRKIKLEETDALVFINFVDSTGKKQSVSIMNGNLQVNIVGSNYIEGYKYYCDEIKIGDSIDLQPDVKNPKDPDAIAAYWNKKRIGYIPKSRIPVVALCMVGYIGCEATVYEKNNGMVAVEIVPTLQNLHYELYNEKYGPFSFEIIRHNKLASLNVVGFLHHFSIPKPKRIKIKSVASTDYASKKIKSLLRYDYSYLYSFDFCADPINPENVLKLDSYIKTNDEVWANLYKDFLSRVHPKPLEYLLCRKSLPEALFFFEYINLLMKDTQSKKELMKSEKEQSPIEIMTKAELQSYIKACTKMTLDILKVLGIIFNQKFPIFYGEPGFPANFKGLYALSVSANEVYLDMINLCSEISAVRAPYPIKTILDLYMKNPLRTMKQFEHYMSDSLNQLVYYINNEPHGVYLDFYFKFDVNEIDLKKVEYMINEL